MVDEEVIAAKRVSWNAYRQNDRVKARYDAGRAIERTFIVRCDLEIIVKTRPLLRQRHRRQVYV